MDTEKEKKISILIVTYNSSSTIEQCLESLHKQTFTNYEILIRDNKSSDNILDLLEKYPGLNIYDGDRNIGFGAAMNYLAARAKGECLFLLNPDCECPENLLQELYDFFQSKPGVLAPSLVYSDGSTQLSARKLPTHANIIFSRRSPFYQLGLVKAEAAGYIASNEPMQVEAVSATALYIAKDLFEKLGGFDQRFFMYGEDIDFCKSLADANVPIWYLPSLKVRHVLGASAGSRPVMSIYHHHLSIFKYFTKHFSSSYIKNSILAILLAGGFLFSGAAAVLGLSRRK